MDRVCQGKDGVRVFIAQVIGNVVSTQKNSSLVGAKLLIVQPLVIKDEQRDNRSIIAIDSIGAGIGETVLVTTGSSARNVSRQDSVADAAIVGIVDSMEIKQR